MAAELLERLAPLVGSGEIVAGIKIKFLRSLQYLSHASKGGQQGGLGQVRYRIVT